MISRFAVFLIFLVALGCGGKKEPEQVELSTSDEKVKGIVETEDQILELTKRLSSLGQALEGIGEISEASIFRKELNYQGLGSQSLDDLIPDLSQASAEQPGFRVKLEVASEAESVSPGQVWKPVLNRFELSHCRFGILEGEILPNDEFAMTVTIEAELKDKNSEESSSYGINATQKLTWSKDKYDRWTITKWQQQDCKLTASPRRIFEDVTSSAIPDKETYDAISRFSHTMKLIKHLQQGTVTLNDEHQKYAGQEDWPSAYQFPTSSVVDYDGDGWEDVFIMDRWGPSYLMKNQGDGTFIDATEESGLTVPSFANCALFADFDNDGDPDAFVCRTLGPSVYFENENGKYGKPKPLTGSRFVVSASVCDINQDGWLDIYLCTYDGGRKDFAIDPNNPDPEKLKEARRATSFIDRSGPPNQVLLNRNGVLEMARLDNLMHQFRNTYQATWSDVDGDGDSDLYLCNDFSPDAFLRNDTEPGSFQLKFTNAADEFFPDRIIGFGMGATWGDFDSDGQMDLYVSNMYSKAGKRIIKMTGEVDPRVSIPSQGNFLFQRQGDQFKQVAGYGENDFHVSKVGWSYGGQFADFNNDGQLDLYVPSGFFTAPEIAETNEDL